MVDYRESPFGRIVEVGWPSDGAVARWDDKGTIGPLATGLYGTITSACGTSFRGQLGVTDGSSVRQFEFFTFAAIDPDFDNTRTHDDWLNATCTGRTSGATFKLSDYVSTVRCTTGSPPFDDKLYGDGASHAWGDGDVSYRYIGKINLASGFTAVTFLITDGLGGDHSLADPWVDTELVDVTF